MPEKATIADTEKMLYRLSKPIKERPLVISINPIITASAFVLITCLTISAITAKNMIYPQTFKIADTDSVTAKHALSVRFITLALRTVLFLKTPKISAHIKDVINCDISRIIPARLSLIMHPPIKDTIYAGEAFAVQYKSLSASFLVMTPLSYSAQTFLTPVGKPEIRLVK